MMDGGQRGFREGVMAVRVGEAQGTKEEEQDEGNAEEDRRRWCRGHGVPQVGAVSGSHEACATPQVEPEDAAVPELPAVVPRGLHPVSEQAPPLRGQVSQERGLCSIFSPASEA